MSRIYFHSEHADAAELRGSERAYMGALCGRLLVATLEPIENLFSREPNPIRRLVPPGKYFLQATEAAFADQFRSWATFSLSLDEGFVYQDGHVNQFDAALNTALALGSDPVKLAARLHGQCEIHCWVEGPHRAWLAGIMEAGRAMRLYRDDAGWEAVIALLRSRDDGPVVCSYSVCDGFPNAGLVHAAGLWAPPPDPEYPDEPHSGMPGTSYRRPNAGAWAWRPSVARIAGWNCDRIDGPGPTTIWRTALPGSTCGAGPMPKPNPNPNPGRGPCPGETAPEARCDVY